MLYLCLKFLTFKTIPQSLRASSLYTKEPLFRQSKGTNARDKKNKRGNCFLSKNTCAL